MHILKQDVSGEYRKYINNKSFLILLALLLLIVAFTVSISLGAVKISPLNLFRALSFSEVPHKEHLIIWNIRLPRTLTALIAGAGLAVAGLVMQSILNNPLGSPFTLGISHAAAFGAAFAVMVLGTGSMQSTAQEAVKITHHYLTSLTAFCFCLLTAGIVLLISRIRKGAPEVMILSGVALGTLYTAGTMTLQYFAEDHQLAAMVFWTFGDTARASWKELGIMTIVVSGALLYFAYNIWNYNTLHAGDETALSLGVNVPLLRMISLFIVALLTAVIIAFLGIIGFIGLICPHIAKRIIGADHHYLLPFTALSGGILLVVSDTFARMILLPHTLPVAILTSFLGGPVFIFLIIKGQRR
jgi:iron complex transport system permease protein